MSVIVLFFALIVCFTIANYAAIRLLIAFGIIPRDQFLPPPNQAWRKFRVSLSSLAADRSQFATSLSHSTSYFAATTELMFIRKLLLIAETLYSFNKNIEKQIDINNATTTVKLSLIVDVGKHTTSGVGAYIELRASSSASGSAYEQPVISTSGAGISSSGHLQAA